MNDNANDTGENNAGVSDKPGYNENRYGYRISIVDGKTGQSLGSVDIATDDFYDFSDIDYTGVGTDQSTTGSTGSYTDRQGELVNGLPPQPLVYDWGKGKFVSNGDAVNNWMMSKNPGTGNENIVDLVLANFAGTEEEKKALKDRIKSGDVKIGNEPMFNIPLYNKGTGVDSYTGVRMTGTIRDVVNVLQEKGYGLGGWMSPVVRAGLEAFFLDHADLGLDTMSAEELEAMIDNIILNGDLSSLGVGMHLYDMSDGTTPPPEEEEPESGEETIYNGVEDNEAEEFK